MHCQICNTILTDEESTFKNITTGLYADICAICLDVELTQDDYDVYSADDLSSSGPFTVSYVAKNQHYDADGEKVLDSDDF